MVEKIVRTFEDLEVYRRSYRLSLEIHKASLGLPEIEQRHGLGDQLRRASKSIPANVAEGFAKQRASSPEFRRYLVIALGSADEMKVWLSYCRDLGYVPAGQVATWIGGYGEIARMLSGLHAKWR